MRALLGILAVACVWGSSLASARAEKSGPLSAEDYEGYGKYFAGTYALIGRLPDTGRAYSGQIVLVAAGKEFKTIRTVAGKRTEGRAYVDVDSGGQHIFVIEFTQGGRRYEGTYLFTNNFDNYPRLAGRVNRPGHSRDWSPTDGLEALFPGDDPACAVGG